MKPPFVTRSLAIGPNKSSLIICVEPWAEEHPMPAGEIWIVEIRGPENASAIPHVIHIADGLIIEAWDRSDYRIVDHAQRLISDWTGVPVPDFSNPKLLDT